METFDAIVIGTGGIGSAVLHQLAKQGHHVLGLDRHPQAHQRGSSHGHTRIIRQGYFEHPDYVPLLLRAYELWRELERDSGRRLFHEISLLEAGRADGILIPGVLESVRQHGLTIERLSAREARKRFPFRFDDAMEVIIEPTGGYLLVEQCVQAQLDQAFRCGATWRQETMRQWSASASEVRVQTNQSTYAASRLVVCGGAWSSALLRDLGVPLGVVEKHLYWFDAPADACNELPVFYFETGHGDFYGFPSLGSEGMKLAQHSGGRRHAAPFDVDSVTDEQDLRQVQQFMASRANFAYGSVTSRKACMYTMSPDGHFVIDRHPSHRNICFAAGLSGHGFKFSPVLGLVLAQLAMQGEPELSVDFLGLDRFSR